MFGAGFVLICLLWHNNGILGLITLWRFKKSINIMSGKREVCRQQLSLKIQQKKVMKKYKMKKNATKKRKKRLPTKQKTSIANIFRKILQLLVKIQFQQLRWESRLHKKIKELIFLYFHIYNLLRSLYQMIYKRICCLSHLKASHYIWW